MAAEKYRLAELVFGWSFYRQSTTGKTSSADEFLDAALTWFGDPDPRVGTARPLVLTRPRLRLRFAKPSESQSSRSRFRWRNAPKKPTRNIAAKKRVRQEDVDPAYLCGDCSQRAVSRFGCGKYSVIKQTLEMQSEDTSATRDPLKEAWLNPGVSG